MADIGCDHGLIPYHVLKNEICRKAVLVDVSEKSLDKAKKLFLKSGLIEKTDFRPGNGLSVLKEGEADFAIIAGLGGMEIIDILSADDKGIGRFLLQPMKNTYELRKFLIKNNFRLEKDFIIFDNGHFYDIIICKRLRIGGYGLRASILTLARIRNTSPSSTCRLLSYSTPKTKEFSGALDSEPSLLRHRYFNKNIYKKSLTEAELVFGRDNIKNKTEDFIKFLSYKKIQTEKILNKVNSEKKEKLVKYLKLIDRLLDININFN